MLRTLFSTIIGILCTILLHTPLVQSADLVEQITVQRFEFTGNQSFSETELRELIQPWLNKPLNFQQLQEVRDAITNYYTRAGYLTSFAILPTELNQDIDPNSAIINIQIIEGKISSIEAATTEPLTKAIARRIPASQVFNQSRLLEQLQFLRFQPGVQDLQAELLPTGEAGQSQLRLNIVPAPRFEVIGGVNTQKSDDTGKIQRRMNFQWLQPMHMGDRLTGNFNNTKGGNTWGLGYTLPIGPTGKTQLGFDYRNLNQKVVRAPFAQLDIRTRAKAFNFSTDRIILQQANRDTLRTAKLGAVLSLVNSRSSILGEPFPLTLESSNEGQLKFSVLRFFQEYQQRSAQSAFSLRSQFNVGLPGGTTGANGIDGQFFAWQAQALINQSVRWGQLGLRLTGQMSTDRLPSYEQVDSARVRGYATGFLPSDSGLMLSNELRIPLQRNSEHGLFATPFLDLGFLHDRPNKSINSIASSGLLVDWLTPSGFGAQLAYEIPLIQNNQTSWQGPQLNFSMQYRYAF